MSDTTKASLERRRLNFAHAVTESFAFVRDFGFDEYELLPTLVRYRKDDLELNVYHGRQSYEIGLEIGRGETLYSISSLIQIVDPERANHYRNWMAAMPDAVVAGVKQLADLLKQYGERALRDDPAFFAALEVQRKSNAEAYGLDVLASQLRPKAEAAFREGRYREAAELYGRIRARLTATETKKLEIALKRSKPKA